MRWLLVLLFLAVAHPAVAQAPAGDEKPPDKPDWAALLGFDRPAAQARYDDEHTPEGWAWARIRQDKPADLNLRCDPKGNTRLNAHDDAGWDDACRKIPAGFLADVLTVARWRDRIGRHGVRLQGARIDGDLDLSYAEIRAALWLDASRIEGTLNLTGARLAGLLSLQRSQLRGDFAADRLRAEASLFLQDHAGFKGNLSLSDARIGGDLVMGASVFDGNVDLSSMTVDGGVFLHGGAVFNGDVSLLGARIGRQLTMNDATFNKSIMANTAVVGDWLLAPRATFVQPLSLMSAHIAGGLRPEGRGGHPHRPDRHGGRDRPDAGRRQLAHALALRRSVGRNRLAAR